MPVYARCYAKMKFYAHQIQVFGQFSDMAVRIRKSNEGGEREREGARGGGGRHQYKVVYLTSAILKLI